MFEAPSGGFVMLIPGLNPRLAVNCIYAFNRCVVLPLGGSWEEPRQSLESLWLVTLEGGREKQTQETSHGWPTF